jgi:hypothetical protein
VTYRLYPRSTGVHIRSHTSLHGNASRVRNRTGIPSPSRGCPTVEDRQQRHRGGEDVRDATPRRTNMADKDDRTRNSNGHGAYRRRACPGSPSAGQQPGQRTHNKQRHCRIEPGSSYATELPRLLDHLTNRPMGRSSIRRTRRDMTMRLCVPGGGRGAGFDARRRLTSDDRRRPLAALVQVLIGLAALGFAASAVTTPPAHRAQHRRGRVSR